MERLAQQLSEHMLLSALQKYAPLGQWKRIRFSSRPIRRAKHFRRSRQCFLEERNVLLSIDGVTQKKERPAQQLSEHMLLNTAKISRGLSVKAISVIIWIEQTLIVYSNIFFYQTYTVYNFLRRMVCAALYPGAPVTPPPGWAPDPHRKRFLTGIW